MVESQTSLSPKSKVSTQSLNPKSKSNPKSNAMMMMMNDDDENIVLLDKMSSMCIDNDDDDNLMADSNGPHLNARFFARDDSVVYEVGDIVIAKTRHKMSSTIMVSAFNVVDHRTDIRDSNCDDIEYYEVEMLRFEEKGHVNNDKNRDQTLLMREDSISGHVENTQTGRVSRQEIVFFVNEVDKMERHEQDAARKRVERLRIECEKDEEREREIREGRKQQHRQGQGQNQQRQGQGQGQHQQRRGRRQHCHKDDDMIE